MLQSLPYTKKQLLSHFVARLSTPFLTYSFQASLMRLLKKRIMQSAEVKNCASIIAIHKKATLVSFCVPLNDNVFNLRCIFQKSEKMCHILLFCALWFAQIRSFAKSLFLRFNFGKDCVATMVQYNERFCSHFWKKDWFKFFHKQNGRLFLRKSLASDVLSFFCADLFSYLRNIILWHRTWKKILGSEASNRCMKLRFLKSMFEKLNSHRRH